VAKNNIWVTIMVTLKNDSFSKNLILKIGIIISCIGPYTIGMEHHDVNNNQENSINECSICRNTNGEDDESSFIDLSCDHKFHLLCLSAWYKSVIYRQPWERTNLTCVICRQGLSIENIARLKLANIYLGSILHNFISGGSIVINATLGQLVADDIIHAQLDHVNTILQSLSQTMLNNQEFMQLLSLTFNCSTEVAHQAITQICNELLPITDEDILNDQLRVKLANLAPNVQFTEDLADFILYTARDSFRYARTVVRELVLTMLPRIGQAMDLQVGDGMADSIINYLNVIIDSFRIPDTMEHNSIAQLVNRLREADRNGIFSQMMRSINSIAPLSDNHIIRTLVALLPLPPYMRTFYQRQPERALALINRLFPIELEPSNLQASLQLIGNMARSNTIYTIDEFLSLNPTLGQKVGQFKSDMRYTMLQDRLMQVGHSIRQVISPVFVIAALAIILYMVNSVYIHNS
jgi:hypothetical protein